MHPMVLLGYEAQLEPRFGLFGDSANLYKIGPWFVRNVPQAWKSFLTQPMELLGDGVIWNLVSVRLEMVLLLVQDRRTVCAKGTIGSEIVLDVSKGTPRSRDQT
jgi:hypothetical protein